MLIILPNLSHLFEMFHTTPCWMLLENCSPEFSGESVCLWNRSRGKAVVLSVLKSLGKLKGKMNGWLGGMWERKPRLRTEVGCRFGITRNLMSKLRTLVTRVFVPSGTVPSKSRVFISLTCAHYSIWVLCVQWMWWFLILAFPLISLCSHAIFTENGGKGIN